MDNQEIVDTNVYGTLICSRAAVEQIRRRAREERALGRGRRVHVLVTGSLYLVGDMLRILGRAG